MNDQFQQVSIECVTGDIANQADMDAVVNAANAELRSGGGVAGALHRAAGPQLAEECRSMAPIAPGEAVISSGHNLPNAWVIHCLGPVYGRDEPADQLLADCYHNALQLADEKGLARVSFPALSTGAFGYPADEAAQICAETVKACLPTLRHLKCLRFVLFDDNAKAIMQAALVEAGLTVTNKA